MIKKILFVLFIGLCFSFSFKKTKKFIPPGTIKINDTLFADETEISNLAWLEYEYWIKTKYGANSYEHLETLPDTLVWRNKTSCNEPYVKYYYRHLAYKDFPVVGISYQQVLNFCKWRGERVKEYLFLSKKNVSINFEYRLPSKQEWELISNNGIDIFISKNGTNQKGNMLLNCIRPLEDRPGTGNYSPDNADVTAPVYSYWKNQFGLYNTIGNVAEMISEKGICKGGSWHHQFEECRSGKNITYSKPEAWLGFRCVCSIKTNSI